MASSESMGEVEELQRVCKKNCLTKTKEEFERKTVVMDRDGHLVYVDERRAGSVTVKRKRKELVLGLNGFEQHTLEEANDIISRHNCSPVSGLGKRIRTSLR